MAQFCKIHEFAIEPTADSFSFFIVFMAHHIKPDSVASYLSGICSQLEPYFPNVRQTAGQPIVCKTMAGMRRLRGTEVRRRQPVSIDDIRQIASALRASTTHDDRLFLAMVMTAFFALMRSGELAWSDKVALQNERKISPRHSVRITDTAYEFLLTGHKGDRFFKGSRIVVQKLDAVEDLWAPFVAHLDSRDALYRYRPELWLRSDGTIPKYSWFTTRLTNYFTDSDRNIGGQSLRAGGATRLAELGTPTDIIQSAGRWSSEAFRIYIHKNPVVLQAMIDA